MDARRPKISQSQWKICNWRLILSYFSINAEIIRYKTVCTCSNLSFEMETCNFGCMTSSSRSSRFCPLCSCCCAQWKRSFLPFAKFQLHGANESSLPAKSQNYLLAELTFQKNTQFSISQIHTWTVSSQVIEEFTKIPKRRVFCFLEMLVNGGVGP